MLHEQNSVAGMANRVLARGPDACSRPSRRCCPRPVGGQTPAYRVSVPARPARTPGHAHRPAARPVVVAAWVRARSIRWCLRRWHVSRRTSDPWSRTRVAKQIDELRANYAQAGVQATLVPFIENMAQAFADADLVICRAGASTVTELAAVGAAAVLVPFLLRWTTTRPTTPVSCRGAVPPGWCPSRN